MKKAAAVFIILTITLMVASLALFNVRPVQAQNSQEYDIERVDHKLQILNDGNVFLTDTIRIVGNSADEAATLESFRMGFPYNYSQYIMREMAYNASMIFQIHPNVPLEGRLGFYAVETVFPQPISVKSGQRRRVVWVAVIAASLKALSPAGNRARPMLAITIQGLLYALAITLLGWNIVGVALSGFLIGAWSAIQGVALQYLFVGDELLRTYDTIIQWIVRKLDVQAVGFLGIVAGWTLVCGVVSSALTLLAWKHRHQMPDRLRDMVFKKPVDVNVEWGPTTIADAIKRGLKDIARPLFWLPVLIVAGVMLASGSSLESVLWIVVRAAVVGFVLFSVVRSFDLRRFIAWLHNRGYRGPALAYRRAMDRMESSEVTSANPKRSSSSDL